MAEMFLSAIAETVLGKIVDLLVQEVSLALKVKTDLEKLKETMSRIKAVLLDAERKQHRNEKLQFCMWKLRDIFYDAEDVIDDFWCEALRKQMANDPNTSSKVRFLSSCSLPLSFSLKMGHKIREINRRLDELATEWSSFNLVQRSDNRRVFPRETHSFVKSSAVFGRDEDKEKIIDLLKRPSEEDGGIPVIPIVGFGGLGKTTLAQLVYNDDRVATLFPLKMWICVSDEFDLRRLLKLIIQSINAGENCDDSALDALQIRLRNLLKDKKFLLVLDDVWNENGIEWVKLRDLLESAGGLSESKIIVTTRSLKVASIMSSIRPYELKGLPHEDCLTLFKKSAFNDGDDRQHPNLMKIGEEIVRKCKGVPLAVMTLGSLLLSQTDEREWVSVRDSELCTLEQEENGILPVLKMSYNYLPSHLQRCFAFLSLYKKDETYHNEKVVRLWMANGLIEHPKQKQELEDVGHRYLNELLSRCLIQKVEERKVTEGLNPKLGFNFKMHDLIHDLALEASQRECKIVYSHTQVETVDENVRHLTFYNVELPKIVKVLEKLKNIRTIIIRSDGEQLVESVINRCASKCKYLRALSLPNSPSNDISNSIGTLKHLRYLRIGSSMGKLPSSLYKLRCLQSLKMVKVSLTLPDGLEGLIELKFLQVSTEDDVHLKEIRPGCWTSLQCLKFDRCYDLECLPEGMQHLTSLRTLVLSNCLELVSLPRSLKFLSKLEVLFICGCLKLDLKMEPEEEEDKHLQLSLKTFSIDYLPALTDLPRVLLEGSSSTLQNIWISRCHSIELPTWLPNLTSLQRLDLIFCRELSALPEGMDRLTRLEQLNMDSSYELCKRYEPGRGADWHKIAHIPNVRFD